MTYYGTKNKDLIIKERSLAANKNYKVSVLTVESFEVYDFSTNSPPRTGNCSTTPSFGKTLDEMHYIECRSNWYDEDSDKGLYYLYLYQASRDANELQVLYFGGESSSPLIPLPVGKLSNSFGSEVRVRVYDIYGDYTEAVTEVASEPRLKGSNVTYLTEKQVTALLESFKANLIANNLIMAGRSGDYIKAVQVIESGASIYNNLELPSTVFSLSPDELSAAGFRMKENGQFKAFSWNEFWINYLNVEKNAQKGILQKTGESLSDYSAELCGTMVRVRSNLTSYIISQFLTSMSKIISNPDYVTYETLAKVLQCALNLTNKLTNLAENIYSGNRMQNMENITLASMSVVLFVTRVLRAIRPTLTPYLPVNPDVETMRAYVQYTELFFTNDQVKSKTLTLQERTFIAMAELKKLQLIQDMKIKWALSLMPYVDDICIDLATTLRTLSGTMHTSSVSSDLLTVMSYNVGYSDLPEGVVLNVDCINFGLKASSPLDIPNRHVVEFAPIYSEGSNGTGSFLYYKFNRKSIMDDVFVYIKSKSSRVVYDIFLKYDVRPTRQKYDFSTTIGPSDWTEQDGFKIYIPAADLDRDSAAVYIGFQPRIVERPVNGVDDAPGIDPIKADVCMRVAGVQCMVRLDETWTDSICKVDPKSSRMSSTTCICTSVSFQNMYIGTTFDIPQALYEYDAVTVATTKSGFSYVYVPLVLVNFIFGMFVFLAWKRCTNEPNWWRCTFLIDNDMADSYFYIMTVFTGFGSEAGTNSNVFFDLSGSEDTSGIRSLKDRYDRPLLSGTVLRYYMSIRQPLGDLLALRIWHDNSGDKNWNWYLKRIIIDDPQIHKRYEFICEKWLAVDKTDGQLLRCLTPTIQSKLDSLTRILFLNMSHFFLYRHLWISLCIRMPLGSFPRYERVILGLVFVLTLMFLNAILVEYSGTNFTENTLYVEPFVLSLNTVYTALGSVAIIVPIFYILSLIFDHSDSITNKLSDSSKLKKTFGISFRLKEEKYIYEQNISVNDYFLISGGRISCKWRTVSWIILALVFFISVPCLLTVASGWDSGKAEVWLSCLLVSLPLSAVIIEPIVVIIASVMYTFLTRRCYLPEPHINLETLRNMNKAESAVTFQKRGPMSRKLTADALPPDKRRLSKLRQLTLHRTKTQHMIISLVYYATFFCVVYIIALVTRDERSFRYKDQLTTRLDFENQVTNRQSLIDWLNTTFFDNYFPSKMFNVTPISADLKYFFSDFNSVRVGPARIRQVRTVPEECQMRIFGIDVCRESYSITTEDTEDYFIGWKTEPTQRQTKEFTTEAWKYVSSEKSWGLPVFGEYIYQYGGGGYFIKLDVNKDVSIEILKELVEFNWIDRNTRAVFIEFSLYNPNINMFLYATYLAEFTEIGSIVKSCYIQTFRLYYTGLGITLCYFVFSSLVGMSILKAFYGIFIEGKYYFYAALNITDYFAQILGVAGIFLIFYRVHMTTTTISVFLRDKNAHVNFEHLALANNILIVIFGVLIFYLSVRIMLEQSDNKWFKNTLLILKKSADDLLGFLILFLIVYWAYTITGHFMFGKYIFKYSSIFETMGTLAESLVGKNQLDPLLKTSPGLAEFYYSTYVLFVLLSMLNIAVSMLNAGIEKVASLDKRKKSLPVGLKTKFLNLMGKIQNTIHESLQKLFERKTRKITGEYKMS
ncbi:hypothetical protein ACJMK2_035124 [Sinanodonta woodiana]|uniref:PLAT domain-containing protein n=1 Tax=Sinanodonta woodiana TaxID=1069815 RepID=A0ABD3WXB4_SINWO